MSASAVPWRLSSCVGVMKTRSVHPERGIASGAIERKFIVVARVRTRAPIA